MLLTDGIHLISDTSEEELHRFAAIVGIARKHFQEGKGHNHYDITTLSMRRKVYANGAQHRTSKQLMKVLRRLEDGAAKREPLLL